MTFDPSDFLYLAPFLILAATGMLLVLAAAFVTGPEARTSTGVAVLGCVVSLGTCFFLYGKLAPGQTESLLGGMLVADRLSMVMTGLFSATGALTALIAGAHQRAHDWEHEELYGILLLSVSGMAVLALAGNLVSVFIGIETMSIGVYVLTAMRKRSRRGNEAAMKYFLVGAFATGFLVYGMALVYGAAGTLDLASLHAGLESTPNKGVAVAGIFLLVVAFGFKVAAVPFHMWAPDAYEGAPTPVTAFMAAAVKSAALTAMIRVFASGLGGDVLPFGAAGWAGPFVVIAAITITVGNIAAVRQNNIKRMLAYSSISHGGILLVGLASQGLGAPSAQPALVYYLIAYSLTTMGAFAVISWVGSRDRERLLIDDWAGLAGQHPGAALAMTVCLLSLGGMPPTGGFFAKFYLFKAAMEVYDQQLLWLVVIGIVNSAISIYYYLRLVTAMYFRESSEAITPTRSASIALVMALCSVLLLEMGILPGFWLGLGG